MTKTILALALFFLSVCTLSAQVSISGKVLDDQDQPIGFASIALLTAQDSQLVKGTLSKESGYFAITEVHAGVYLLLINMLGFETQYTEPFTITAESKNVQADIKLQAAENILNEAVIVAKRPLFEQKADRLIMNVANSPVASGGTALEILQKVPGVLVIQDRVTLAGNSNPAIWIDGKPSQYADMNAVLRDLPGDQIHRVELITQPGALSGRVF